MLMDVVVEIPIKLIMEASEKIKEVKCGRKQPFFELFPNGHWRLSFTCGTNRGRGSDNGYGIAHRCSAECDLRMPMKGESKK